VRSQCLRLVHVICDPKIFLGQLYGFLLLSGKQSNVVVEFEKWVRFGFGRVKTANESSESSERYD